jgi:hypothetical protein
LAPWAVHHALGIGFSLVRERKPGLIGAVACWGFDIVTLWACFHAFGSPPTVAVIVMAYFVGALANTRAPVVRLGHPTRAFRPDGKPTSRWSWIPRPSD